LRPDLLQGWMYHGNLAAQMMAAALPASVPVTWGICNGVLCDEKLVTSMTVWLGARLSRLPARIITDSAASAEAHQRRLNFSASRWEVIPNGFDLEQFQPCARARSEVRAELSAPANALLVGLVGRYHPVKDHAGFLEAAALIRRQTPQAKFLLAGSGIGSNPVLMKQAAALGLIDVVHLLDERADVHRIMAALDIAVCSSYSESFPNVVGEAMCCGVPCVVTDVGSTAYLVGDTGLVVPPRDPLALANACGELIRLGGDGRRALGRAARGRIAERFSIASIAARYERLYEQVIGEKRGAKSQDQCAA
jgi:glycosyltransferase involved in cell wall biosynthesis